MSTFDLKTRDFGEVRFACRDDGGYVRVYSADLGRHDGKQICHGGGFSGSTISADAKSLEAAARKWWRQYLRAQREFA